MAYPLEDILIVEVEYNFIRRVYSKRVLIVLTDHRFIVGIQGYRIVRPKLASVFSVQFVKRSCLYKNFVIEYGRTVYLDQFSIPVVPEASFGIVRIKLLQAPHWFVWRSIRVLDQCKFPPFVYRKPLSYSH